MITCKCVARFISQGLKMDVRGLPVDPGVLGLAMADNRKAQLCVSTIENAHKAFPSICGAIIHSDRGSQYTSASYRAELNRYGIVQSMNSDGRQMS